MRSKVTRDKMEKVWAAILVCLGMLALICSILWGVVKTLFRFAMVFAVLFGLYVLLFRMFEGHFPHY